MGQITDVPGIKVGEVQDEEALTGLTVLLCPEGMIAGVDVRGSAPGTRETELLDPSNLVSQIQAIALCGGSAYGLAATDGVMTYLREQGYGFKTGDAIVPIVPAAVIYDLGLGSAERYPDSLMGYLACTVADKSVFEGNFGAGTGASVGKVAGMKLAMKGGTGTSSTLLQYNNPLTGASGEYIVGALVVTNAFGDIIRDGSILAGAVNPLNGKFLDTVKVLRSSANRPQSPLSSNTTLGIVATNAPLNKAAARKLAQMAQDGLARAIRPAHTMFDGDTVFAVTTDTTPAGEVDPVLLTTLGALAAELMAEAIWRSVLEARPAGGLPALSQKLDPTA